MDIFPIAEKIYLSGIKKHVQELADKHLKAGGKLIYDDGELDDEDLADMLTPSLIIQSEALFFHIGQRDYSSTAFIFIDRGSRPGELPLEIKMSRQRRPLPLHQFLDVVTEIFEVQLLADAPDLRRFINRVRQNLPI